MKHKLFLTLKGRNYSPKNTMNILTSTIKLTHKMINKRNRIKSLFLILPFVCRPVSGQIVFELNADTSNFPDIKNRIKNESVFIRLDSNNFVTYFRRSALYYQVGNYEAAIKDFNKILLLRPNDPDAYSNRGMCNVFLKDYPKAFNDLDMAIKLEPEKAINYLNRAFAFSHKNKYKEAIVDLNKAIELRPDYAKAYVNRGFARRKLNFYREALMDYDKAILLNPDYLEAVINRAEVNYLMKNYSDAIKDFERALKIEPFLESYWFFKLLGEAYGITNDETKSRINLEKAMKFAKDSLSPTFNRPK